MATQLEGFSPATILDVARRAGVSRTTVSRVLNEPTSVSKDTLARVQQAAAELNYVPSSVARSLRGGRTGTIALLVADISEPYCGSLAKAVAQAAEARGLTVALCDLAGGERLVQVLARLPRQGVDGIIIATGDDVAAGPIADAIADVTARSIAVVATVCGPGDADIIGLRIDYQHVAAVATAHLISQGAREIVLLAGPETGFHSSELATGYRQAIRAVAGASARVVWGECSYDDSVRAVTELLTNEATVDGIVAGTVPSALGAIRALEAFGRRVPHDVALVACEEVPLARQVRPAISTVALDLGRIGDEAVRLLSAAIGGGQPEPSRIQPVRLIRDT